MLKIYVGAALSQSDVEFRNNIEELKSRLAKTYDVLRFLGLSNGTSKEVYQWDRNCVLEADIFLAICTEPSTGLGIEIGFAIENDIPLLCVAQNGVRVSRMVLGIQYEHFLFKTYNNIMEVDSILNRYIQGTNIN